MINNLRAFIRIIVFAIVSIVYIIIGYPYLFLTKNKPLQILKLRRLYVKLIFLVLGIRTQVRNVPKLSSFLLIVNHRTYLDPVIIAEDLLMFPLAKMEVSKWPLIGIGAKLSGGFFVERENKKSRKEASQKIVNFIKEEQKIVMICPEGTTHTQPQTIEFKPRTFVNAAENNIAIVPAAIEYGSKNDAWVGDDTFIRHFIECFGKRRTRVILSYGNPIKNNNWEELLKETKTWIDQEMLVIREELGYEAFKKTSKL